MEKDDFKRYLYYGFDKVENPYARTQEIKQVPILDEEKITELSGKSWFETLPGINQFDYKIIVSQTESELERRSAAECGISYQGTEFEFQIKQSQDYSECNFVSDLYGKVVSNCLQAQIATKLDLEALRKCVADDFIKAVQKGDMEKVFETYGTHLISHVLIGGRMMIQFRTKKNTQRTTREIRTLAEESYKAFVANETITYSHSQVEFSQFCEYSIWGIGGNVSYLPTQFGKNKEYHKWVESLEFQPALYQVTNCIPIWELVSEEETKKALKKAYLEHYNGYLTDLRSSIPFITDMRVALRKDNKVDSELINGEVVTKTDKALDFQNSDLNRHAGGDYIYLIYQLGNNQSQKITDIILNETDRPVWTPAKKDFSHLNGDMNAGAGGKYIYINYKRERDVYRTGYQAICTRNVPDALPGGWSAVENANGQPVDLNKGAGGDYIYLFVYRDPLFAKIDNQIRVNKEEMLKS